MSKKSYEEYLGSNAALDLAFSLRSVFKVLFGLASLATGWFVQPLIKARAKARGEKTIYDTMGAFYRDAWVMTTYSPEKLTQRMVNGYAEFLHDEFGDLINVEGYRDKSTSRKDSLKGKIVVKQESVVDENGNVIKHLGWGLEFLTDNYFAFQKQDNLSPEEISSRTEAAKEKVGFVRERFTLSSAVRYNAFFFLSRPDFANAVFIMSTPNAFKDQIRIALSELNEISKGKASIVDAEIVKSEEVTTVRDKVKSPRKSYAQVVDAVLVGR